MFVIPACREKSSVLNVRICVTACTFIEATSRASCTFGKWQEFGRVPFRPIFHFWLRPHPTERKQEKGSSGRTRTYNPPVNSLQKPNWPCLHSVAACCPGLPDSHKSNMLTASCVVSDLRLVASICSLLVRGKSKKWANFFATLVLHD